MKGPTFSWPEGRRLALSLVVNVEEGAEMSILDGDPRPEPVDEMGIALKHPIRNYGNESNYRYGITEGFPRVAEMLDRFEFPATWTTAAVALERAPEIADYIRERGDEAASHGYRWVHQFRMDEAEERQFLRSAVASITESVGTRPVGHLSRYLLTDNTRRLLAEEGFTYHMDDYSADAPFWASTEAGPIVVVPYAVDTNDMKLWADPSYTPREWLEYAVDTFDRLYSEGSSRPPDDVPRTPPANHRSARADRCPGAIPGTRQRLRRRVGDDPEGDRQTLRRRGTAADMTRITSLLADFATGRETPSQVLEACLGRIAKVDLDVGAVLTLVKEHARAAAKESDRRWEAGTPRPLEGVPFGVKDVIDTAGIRTTYGSPIFADHVPDADAPAVARLRAAGAVLVAKLQTYEFAFGDNPHFGPVRNPHHPDRIPGGSSDGPAAAVAAGELPLAMGTDTGGSIRLPAAFCGVTGFKPSAGMVSTEGVFPHAPSLDTVGTITVDAAGARLALANLAPQAVDPTRSLADLRVGVPTNWFWDQLAPAVATATRAAAERASALGARVEELMVGHVGTAEEVCWTLIATETARSHRPRWGDPRLGPVLADLIARGRQIPEEDQQAARAGAAAVRAGAAAAFREVDLLLTPGPPCTAPHRDDLLADLGNRSVPWLEVVARNTMWHNVVGCPVVVLPAGADHGGLPVAVQLAGPPGADHQVLAAAAELEAGG